MKSPHRVITGPILRFCMSPLQVGAFNPNVKLCVHDRIYDEMMTQPHCKQRWSHHGSDDRNDRYDDGDANDNTKNDGAYGDDGDDDEDEDGE